MGRKSKAGNRFFLRDDGKSLINIEDIQYIYKKADSSSTNYPYIIQFSTDIGHDAMRPALSDHEYKRLKLILKDFTYGNVY